MHKFFYKALTNATIITIVFLIINQFDVYLEENYKMNDYQINFLKAPVQFVIAVIVNMIVMYSSSRWFNVKQ
jgi:hypothetical protein